MANYQDEGATAADTDGTDITEYITKKIYKDGVFIAEIKDKHSNPWIVPQVALGEVGAKYKIVYSVRNSANVAAQDIEREVIIPNATEQQFLSGGWKKADDSFQESSGGAYEESTHIPQEDLYQPEFPYDYGGFLQARFFHSPYSHITNFKSALYQDPIPDDWYLITFTRKDNYGAMYINGELISVGTLMPNYGETENAINVGCVAASSWRPDAFFNGRLDQIAIWDKELKPNDVQELYNNGSGKKFSQWSNNLKADTWSCLEFDELIVLNSLGQVVGNLNDAATGASRKSWIRVENTSLFDQSDSFNMYSDSGKVSNYSAKMVYEDDFSNASLNTYLGLNAAQTIYNRSSVDDSKDCACRYMIIPKALGAGTGVEWSLSSWVSIHGVSYSYYSELLVGTGKNAAGVDPSFEYKNGSRVATSYGVIFSDYSGYSNGNARANFTIAELSTYERYGGWG